MEQFFVDFVGVFQNLSVKEIIDLVLRIFLFIVVFIRTGKKGVIKSMLKYRTEKTALDESAKSGGHKYDPKKSVYRLNLATDELKKTDEKTDLQELVNSNKDVALDKILDKFLEPDPSQVTVGEFRRMADDLDMMSQALDTAEDYRERYHLPDDWSPLQVFNYVNEQAEKMRTTIQGTVSQAQAQELKKTEKGEKEDEKKI